VGCLYNLYLDVNEDTGSIKFNFPDLEPWEVDESCVLDVAARGEHTLEECGALMNLTRERIRQYEEALIPLLAARDRVQRIYEEGLESSAENWDGPQIVGIE